MGLAMGIRLIKGLEISGRIGFMECHRLPSAPESRTALRIIITQNSLVALLRVDSSDSDWKRFYALYENPILAFAAARSLNETETFDLLQEIMIKMLRGGFSR